MSARRSLLAALLLTLPPAGRAEHLPRPDNVELQPLAAQAKRVADALEFLGTPLLAAERQAIEDAAKAQDKKKAVLDIQTVLDRHCLFGIYIDKEKFTFVHTQIGPAKPEMAEQGWR